MKTTKFLLILLSLFIGQGLSAQVSLGVKGGYTKAWQDYGDTQLPEDAQIHVNGIYAGLMTYISIGNTFQLGIEPSYVERGAACIPGFIDFNGDTKWELNYLEVPLFLSAEVSLLKEKLSLQPKIGGGPSIILNAYQEQIFFGSDAPPTRTRLRKDEQSDIRFTDWGLQGGLAFAYQLPKSQLRISFDYYHGLQDVRKNTDSQNRSISLGLGYVIRL